MNGNGFTRLPDAAGRQGRPSAAALQDRRMQGLDALTRMADADGPTPGRQTSITNPLQGRQGKVCKEERPIPLSGVYGSVFYGQTKGGFRPSAELMSKELRRYQEAHKLDVYDRQIKQLEDGLCEKLGISCPHPDGSFTMGVGKATEDDAPLVMGLTTNDPQHKKLWGISQLDRTFHTITLGSTGSGKSTFLRGLLVQDMWANRAGLLMEPHGDFCAELLLETPPYRLHNVIYLDTLGDREYSPGFNPLQVPLNAGRDARADAVQNVVSLIAKHFSMDQGAVQLKKNLENALNALAWCPGATILEVMDFYSNEDVRKTVLDCMPDGADKDRIRDAAGNVKPADLGSLENRIAAFQNNQNMRRMFGQSRTTIDFYSLMNKGYMIITPLSKGISTDDSFRNFVGAYIISTIYHDSMKRANIPQDQRVIFPLTIDEFQNFASGDDVAGMISECRKYGLPLLLANQYLGQLDSLTRTAIEQCGTKALLKLTPEDSVTFARGMDNVSAVELANIPRFHAVIQTIRNSQGTTPFMSQNMNIDKIEKTLMKLPSQQRIAQLVKDITHEKFMKKASEIDDEIDERHAMLAGGASKEELAKRFLS